MIKLILVLMVAAAWAAQTNERAFSPTPAVVPWADITVTNYRAACIDYREPRDPAELAVPGLDELDQWGDPDTYSAATADNRVFLLPCRVTPPAGIPGS